MSDLIKKGVYSVYDVVARQVITTFHSDNDEKAVRDCSYRVSMNAPLADLYLYRIGDVAYNPDERYSFTFVALEKAVHIPWSSYEMLVDAPNLAEAKTSQEAHQLFKEHLTEVAKVQKRIEEEESSFVKS